MTPGNVDRYAHLEVRIKTGHNPDLVVTDATGEQELRRFDLTKYETNEALHELVQAQGFVLRSDAGTLENKHEKCYSWRNMGECLKNPTFMRDNCALACHDLADRNEQCETWAKDGQCDANPKFMYPECPVACGWKQEL